jgi:hypothetical protein
MHIMRVLPDRLDWLRFAHTLHLGSRGMKASLPQKFEGGCPWLMHSSKLFFRVRDVLSRHGASYFRIAGDTATMSGCPASAGL